MKGADFISFIEQAPIAAAMFDLDMRYVAISPRWLEERNLDASILGQTAYEVFPDVAATFQSRHLRALAGETIAPTEDRLEAPHGAVEWVRSEIRPWFDAEGAIGGVIIFAEDITARKKAEEAHRKSEEELRRKNEELEALYQNAPIGLCYLDKDLRYLRINRRLAEINGLPVEAHLGRTVAELIPTLAEEAQRLSQEILATNLPVRDIEFIGETPLFPEKTRYWNEAWYPVFEQNGALNGFGVVVEEITQRRKAEKELKENTERLDLAQTAAQIGIWSWEIRTGKTWLNGPYYAIFGIPDGFTMTYEDFLARLHPEDRAAYEAMAQRAFSGDGQIEGECRIIRDDDGATRWIKSKGKIYFDADGAPLRAMGAVWDISALKELQDAMLRRVEDRYRKIIEIAQEGVWLLDPDGRTTFVNPKMAQMMGYASLEMLGRHLLDFMDDEWKRIAEQKLIDRASGVVETHDFKFRRKDGSTLWALLSCTPIFEGNLYQGALATVMDFTERKQLEEEKQRYLEEIQRSDRRKDEFLATMAHELRTPLATIALGLDVVEGDGVLSDRSRSMCARMQRQVGHLRRMVEDILQVSRLSLGKIELRRRPTDLNQLVHELEETLRPTFTERGVRFEVHLAREAVPLFADDFRLTQALGNILDNAAKFTDPGGSVVVSVSTDGETARVTVRDTGMGIPPERLSWVFEPFNQMKHGLDRNNNGIGVGLALARKITELHQGQIAARSEGVGEGSEFVLQLPLSAE